MTSTIIACVFCKHYREDGDAKTCVAFPDGIPDSVLYGTRMHLTSWGTDNGIVYEPKDSALDPFKGRADSVPQ